MRAAFRRGSAVLFATRLRAGLLPRGVYARALAVTLSGIGLLGCGNSLVGVWGGRGTGAASPLAANLTLESNGRASFALVGDSAGCVGTLTWVGGRWSSSSSTITMSGPASCSGSVTCGATTLDCSSMGVSVFEDLRCGYTLLHSLGASGGDGDSLTLTCPGRDDQTLGRQMQ